MPFLPGPRRAEKDENGDKAYLCSWEGCAKKFGTAGHVRRHEKTHIGSTPYSCPYCSKSFGRSDVRAKHVSTMHRGEECRESDGESPAKSRRLSYDSTASSRKLSSSSIATVSEAPPLPNVTLPGSSHLLPPLHSAGLPIDRSEDSNPGRLSGGVQSLLGLDTNLQRQQHGMFQSSPSSSNAPSGATPFMGQSTPGSGFIDPANLNVASSSTIKHLIDIPSDDILSTPTIPSHPELLTFDPSWEWFGNLFGWGSNTNIDLDVGLQNSMFESNGVGPASSTDTLSAAWLLCTTPRGGSPVTGEAIRAQGVADPFGRKDDTPWPNIFKPNVPDRPLTLGGVKASSNIRSPRPGPKSISEASRNAMLSLIYLSHQPHWLMPDIDDFPDHDTLSDFVDLYFEKFHPMFPILHRPTFRESDTPAVLLLSVAAIGATFADLKYRPLAVALCELVRRMITWMRGSDQRAKFDRYALAAFTLQTALGVVCGSREMFYHAEIFRCSLVTTCRRLHLLRGLDTATDELYKRTEHPSNEERYKAYLKDEGRRRLGWGVYFLDAQMSAMLLIPPIFMVNEARIHPPTDEALWEAPSAEAWASVIARGEAPDPRLPRPRFLKLLSMCMAGQDGQIAMSDFTVGIVTYTIWRLLMDQRLLQKAIGLGLSENGMDLAAYPAQTDILDTQPGYLLTRLATSTFPIRTPSCLRLTPAALYHHARLIFTRPGLIQRIKHVSGKYEPDMTQEGSLSWLKTWLADGSEVRKLVWHAGVLNELMAENPRGSIGELIWTFDCALIFWIVLKHAPQQLSSASPVAFFAANWLCITPPEMWISHGGQITFPLLGSSTTWTVSTMLKIFMDRLHKMPWGLAVQNRLVLNKLLEAEGAVD
ncbi:hypothetical protein C361_03202 [Cryptococcus neoformans Tu259-1]|uniref:C2H2-type domain-containing protein n=1 Tax=Cryptococcus neoformans Tu259-1 TaxID=1230072 RepID=A0A854QIP6_CRYNE|nr:hypothetical protein C361_03202 [Cryptococcus neoformans var. grubii Tu259-1]